MTTPAEGEALPAEREAMPAEGGEMPEEGEWKSVEPGEDVLFFQKKLNAKDCMQSCENFQASLSECVATIIFDTGKIAVMKEKQPSGYNSYVGGCMSQLQAYHTATHTPPGAKVIIPGASGCTVH